MCRPDVAPREHAERRVVEFRDTFARTPILADKVQFGVLDFSDNTRTVIPLGDFTSADLERRRRSTRGGTSYGRAFTTMRATIEADMAAGAGRYRYLRPAVFSLTDGLPTDGGWPDAFAALTAYDRWTGQGFKQYPLFVPFGIGAADGSTPSLLKHPQDRSVLSWLARGRRSPPPSRQ